jgi:Bacterial conjugation TrbI-like protein
MSTKNEREPGVSLGAEIDAPFGRRLYDEEFHETRPRVELAKFSLILLLGVVFILLQEIAPATRKSRLTPRPLVLPLGDVHIEGDKIVVPALVASVPREHETKGSRVYKVSPIQVLSFVGKEIPPGAEGQAVLLSGGTNGLVKARLTESVKVDGTTVLESGVLLLGEGHSSEERLYIDFRRAVFRSGNSMAISAQAYDVKDAILGLRGSRVNDMTLKIAATSGLNFLSGMALGFETPSFDEIGRPHRPSARDAALNGVAQAAGEEAKRALEDVKNRAPVIEVPAGTSLIVTFDGGRE